VHSRCLHYLSVRVGLGGSVNSRTDRVTERLVVICRRVGIARVCVRVQYGYSVREGAGGRERERERVKREERREKRWRGGKREDSLITVILYLHPIR
jgi:hypothetical protein